MSRRKTDLPVRSLVVSLAVSVLLLAIGHVAVPEMTVTVAARRLLWPLARLLAVIGIGLLAGQVIEAAGWVRQMAVVSRPLLRFGHLGDHCGAAFTTAFFSGTAANAMLLEFYQEGRIGRRQLFLTNLLSQFPAYFLHLPTTLFVVLSLTGWAGALYFCLTFFALVLRCVALLFYGRLSAPARTGTPADAGAAAVTNPVPKAWAGIWAAVGRKLPRRLTTVAVWVVPIYIMVHMLNAMGLFQAAENLLAGTVAARLVPVESLSMVVLGFVAEFTSGFATAGALMDAGVLSVKQTTLALLIGNVIAFPIRALRHQLPHYMGIFTPRLGVTLLLTGQAFRVGSLVLVGAFFALFG